MLCFSQFCHVCLKVDFKLKNLYSIDEDQMMLSDKFKRCVPEIDFKEDIPLFICNNCCVELNNVHKFRELSIKNISVLKKYSQQIKTVTETAKTIEDQLHSILSNVHKDAQILSEKTNQNTQNNFGESSSSSTHNFIENIEIDSSDDNNQNDTNEECPENNNTEAADESMGENFDEININDSLGTNLEVHINENLEHKDGEESLEQNVECELKEEPSHSHANLSSNEDSSLHSQIGETVQIKQEYEDDDDDDFEPENILPDDGGFGNPSFEAHIKLEEQRYNSPLQNLAEKSRKKYVMVYQAFMDWRSDKNISSFCENVLLAYFNELAEKYKSSSLWVHYSMLKSTLNINHSVNIESYTKLKAFLKHKAEGYHQKKAKTFAPHEINSFINNAPDNKYLATKVALIMGIVGACHAKELHAMNVEDFLDLQSAILVTVPNPKTKTVRKFTITGQFYHICKKYADLRPSNATFNSFFLNYHNGKCISQRIGINKFGGMGKEIARFLKLPDPQMYTGHSFRKSSATLLFDADGDITAAKKHEDKTANKPICNLENEAITGPGSLSLLQQFQEKIFSAIEETPQNIQNQVQAIEETSIKTETTSTESEQPYDHFLARNIDENRPFRCEVCGKCFTKKGVLDVHSRLHTGETPFQCQICQKCFRYKSSLDTHISSHSKEKKFKCTLCEKKFKRKVNLKIHTKIHMGEKPHKCTYCPKTFLYKTSLDGHIRIHTGEKMVDCPTCDRSFKNKFHFEIHYRTHSGERPFKCQTCGSSFTQKNNLDRHMRSHDKEKIEYKCDVCEKTFQHKFHLQRHYKIHDQNRNFECTVCQKVFLHEKSLERHMAFHTGINLLQCTLCPKTFLHRSNLNIHIKTHLGEKPHGCQFCDKRFTQKNNLTRHLRIHTGNKPFVCTYCPKTFNEKFHLIRHTRIHTGERPFDCPICGKSFTQKHIMEKHKATHSPEEFYNLAQGLNMQADNFLQEDIRVQNEPLEYSEHSE